MNLEDRIGEESRIRSRLRSLCKALPNLSCVYFVYVWQEDSKHKTYDIKGNPARLALWQPGVILPPDDWEPEKPAKPTTQPTPGGNPVSDNETRAAQMGGQTLTVDQLHAKRWQVHAMPPLPAAPQFAPQLGFESFWRKRENAWIGSPLTVREDIVTFADGSTAPARAFSNACLFWGPNGATVLE